MGIPKKPDITPDIEAMLLGGAKAERPKGLPKSQDGAEGPEAHAVPGPASKPKASSKGATDINALLGGKPKTFLVTFPNLELHKAAAGCAAGSVPKKTLHEYILEAIAEKVIRDRQAKN